MSSDLTSEKLRICRKQSNLTQDQVAQTLHVTRQTISKWDNVYPKKHLFLIMGYVVLYLLFIMILPRLGVHKGYPLGLFQCRSYIVLGTGGFMIFRKDFIEGSSFWKGNFICNLIWLIVIYLGGVLLENLAVILMSK